MRLSARILIVLPCLLPLLAGSAGAQSQIRYEIAPRSSLAWWQIDPNYGHLWSTTCPDDPNWQAGEGRSPTAPVNFKTRKRHVASASADRDRDVPMYPRLEVYDVCRDAVRGGLTTSDTITWRDVRGEVIVLPDSLDTGLGMRTLYARKSIFQTHKFRNIRFVLDSLSNLQRSSDTIYAVVHGMLELHGVQNRITSDVKAWPEAGGLRVQSFYEFPAGDLTGVYKMSKMALEMGTALGRWNTVYFGIDAILLRR